MHLQSQNTDERFYYNFRRLYAFPRGHIFATLRVVRLVVKPRGLKKVSMLLEVRRAQSFSH